jgi:hypothetical protein
MPFYRRVQAWHHPGSCLKSEANKVKPLHRFKHQLVLKDQTVVFTEGNLHFTDLQDFPQRHILSLLRIT